MQSSRMTTACAVGIAVLCHAAAASAAEKRVCVEVELVDGGAKDTAAKKPATPAALGEEAKPAPIGTVLPIGQTPVGYLRRLFEHFITHEPGFEAITAGCEERVRVELYPLAEGWTAFARYSGTGREERVDQLHADELSQFAERAVLALLYNAPIGTTINRDTVLRGDSKKSVQRIEGSSHLGLSLGTQLRLGQFATAQGDGATTVETRVFSPMTFGVGYRGKFEAWGVDAGLQGGVGTTRTAARMNGAGGHVDYAGGAAASLHFLRYLKPRDLTSFYYGAGSSFELLWFDAIRPAGDRGKNVRSSLNGGGLDVDLVWGWEFMRASTVQFYLQGELNLPAYVVQTADDYAGKIDTWFPAATLKLGMMF
jgi:hypothetical protein